MSNITKEEKKTLKNKFREYEKQGLLAYGKYLQEQLVYASKSDIRAAYKKYIEKQILRNNEKIEHLNTKLKQ